MREKELELKTKNHLWEEKEAEQSFKMKTLARVQELKSPPFEWDNNQIKMLLGPACEPILEIFGE